MGHRKKADYAFFIQPNFQDPVWFLEAKKPSVPLTTADNYFQAIRYGWNGQTPIVVLTNFRELHIIDSRYKPHHDTVLNRWAKIYHYSEYADELKFREIYSLLSRQAVGSGSIQRFISKISTAGLPHRQLQLLRTPPKPMDDDFLQTIETARLTLARAFTGINPAYSDSDLTEMTQRTIDRLVLTRFLEDKAIETEPILERCGQSATPWRDFVSVRQTMDDAYNGVVFKEHVILDRQSFEVDQRVFVDVTDDFRSDTSPYLFNTVPIEILGSIYERFLGKVIENRDGRIELRPKPELRKANGIYYTPRAIVNYIVSNTIRPLIQNKTPKAISALKFIDIACGSGSFLLGIYDELLRYHTSYYNANPSETTLKDCFQDSDGHYHLTLQKKRDILVSNVFGIDLDPQAVEVAQLSLSLKLLEEETHETAINYQEEFKNAILPSLAKNIICGNSIIDREITRSSTLTQEQERSLNPVDYHQHFGKILNKGGFDAVIGNPPYYNVDSTWGRKDYRLALLKRGYPDVHTDKTDVLFYFLRKAQSLSKGKNGFIVSRAMLEAFKATKLRKAMMMNCPSLR